MRTCSCFRVTTLLLALALTADGGVHEILEEAACLHHSLFLNAVCGSDQQLVLRSLTLARAVNIPGVVDCAVEIEQNFPTSPRLAGLCCRLKPPDCTVPIELPSQNRSVLQEFAGFVDKCRAGGASQCDLTNVTSQGTVPPLHLSGSGKDCGNLSYVSVGYSCIRDQDVVPLSGADLNQTFPEGHVTLVSQENVTAARCLLYSPACDVTVGVGVLDADPRASCSLELSQGSRTQVFSCSSPPLYRSWNSTLFNSSHVTISVNVSSPSPRALWLTAEVLPRGAPLTMLCGQAAIIVSPPACHTTASTSTSAASTSLSTLSSKLTSGNAARSTQTATTAPAAHPTASVVPTSSLAPSSTTTLKPAVPVAVGWAAFNVTDKVVCQTFPLILSDSCDDPSSLALRAITLGRSADSSCAAATIFDLQDFTFREKCCQHRPEDTGVTYHLPFDRDSLPWPYKELADKCSQTPDHCDLYGIPGVNQGKIPPGTILNQASLTYVAVSFTCTPKAARLTFTESGNLTAQVVSLRMDGNSPVSSQCLIYSKSCDVTIKLGIIDVNVSDPCTLTLDDGSPVTKSCSSLRTQRQPLLQNSNAVAVSLHFNGSGVARQRLWLEAEGWDKSPLTAVCGASAPAVSSVRCAPASTSPTVPTKTAVPTDVPTKTAVPTDVPTKTAISTHAPTNTVGCSNFTATEKVFCKFSPLNLNGSCDVSHSLALRAITLATSADSSCAAASYATVLDLTVRDKCCQRRAEDTGVTYQLPSARDSLPWPYRELAGRCWQTPERCDLHGIPGVVFGQVPPPPDQGPLSYVALSYSCVPKTASLQFTEDRTVTAQVVSLRMDENSPVSSQCLIYSDICDVTITLQSIYVSVHDPCTLTLDDRNYGTENCSSLQTQPQPLLKSSSNAVAVSLHFNGSGVERQTLWLEAEGSDKSLITAVCGASAPAAASLRCVSQATGSKTTAPTTPAPTTPAPTTTVPTTTVPTTPVPTTTAVPTSTTHSDGGLTALNVMEEVVCEGFTLTLRRSCDASHSVTLRAITLGRSANSFCADASHVTLLDLTFRAKCCQRRPEDTTVTYHLPSDRNNLPFPYKELADKCLQTPDHCDLYDIPGIVSGRVPRGIIPNHGRLVYVALSYSCVPKTHP